jgi:hypothetical protein
VAAQGLAVTTTALAALTVTGGASESASWRTLVRPPWRGVFARAAAVPVLVMLPLLTVAPKADNRFDSYRWGAEYAARPWRIVSAELAAVPGYLDVGNFRPLGRMFERGLNVVTHHLSVSLQLPVPIAMRMVHLLSASVLSVVLVLTVEALGSREPLRHRRPSALGHLLAFVFAAGLVAAGSTSTIVIFTDLYLLSTALVLLAVMAAARADRLHQQGLPVRVAVVALAVGAAAAAFNEITYLTVPLALVAVVVRGRLVADLSWARLRRSTSFLSVMAAAVAFVAVFAPARVVIAQRCADGGCYSESAVSLDPAFVPAFAARMVSWAPPIAWQVATVRVEGAWFFPRDLVTVLLVLGLAALAWRATTHAASSPAVPPRALVAVAVFGVAVLTSGATMAALSEAVQRFTTSDWRVALVGWRDQQLSVAGGAIVITAVLVAWMQRHRRPRPPAGGQPPGVGADATQIRGRVGAVTLGLLAALSLLANQGYAADDARRPASVLNNRIALSVIEAPDDPASNELRCTLLDEFSVEAPAYRWRMQEALDVTMQHRHGFDYCVPDPGAP